MYSNKKQSNMQVKNMVILTQYGNRTYHCNKMPTIKGSNNFIAGADLNNGIFCTKAIE
jgi:hypothetical protein